MLRNIQPRLSIINPSPSPASLFASSKCPTNIRLITSITIRRKYERIVGIESLTKVNANVYVEGTLEIRLYSSILSDESNYQYASVESD